MGLFQKAIETYDVMHDIVGIKDAEHSEILAPIGYMTTTAKIEITIDNEGNFVRANKIDEKIAIPCTESSAGRSSGFAAHPLCDNLGYVTEFYEEKHALYLKEINAWSESIYGNSKLQAICKYLDKGNVFIDCKKAGLLTIETREDKNKNLIENIKEEKDIVTWRVEGLGKDSGAVHEDSKLMESYSEFYLASRKKNEGICMVSGDRQKLAMQHLKGVSNFSGNAKLVSSNDNTNYTYKGRFINSDEAMTMGYVSSQKAHNALKWLLSNFGVSIGTRRMVCWSPQGYKVPSYSIPLLAALDTKIEPSDYKRQLENAVRGYKCNLPDNSSVVIAAFEAATSGRLSVTYYNELRGSDFLERLYYWDSTCCWYDNRWGVRSPSLFKIINYAFGTERSSGKVECDDRVLSQQLQRVIECRLNKNKFPKDIMRNLVIKASNLVSYSSNTADNILFVACAVIKKCRFDHFKEEWKMAVDESVTDRSYLFGRLLAVLEKIEKDTYRNGEDRETNAIRAQAFYKQRPFTAFSQIMTSLKTGYYPKLSTGTKNYYEKLVGNIMEKISLTEEDMNKPLSETYLLGYYLQKNALYTKKENIGVEED